MSICKKNPKEKQKKRDSPFPGNQSHKDLGGPTQRSLSFPLGDFIYISVPEERWAVPC